MAFRDISLRRSYETTANAYELVDEFYTPMLENSRAYLRVAGFFNSSSLSIASKGIAGLVDNNGTMKLLISPELSNKDYEILKIRNSISDDFDLFKDFDLNLDDENLKLFSWLLANGKLEIKIVVDKKSQASLFHQKFGIFFDKDNFDDAVSFSGSINESARAWLSNIEEFKVFRSWNSVENEYLVSDLAKFNSYWNNEKADIADVYDIPSSIKEKIISIKPDDVYDLELMKKYKHRGTNKKLNFFEHQLNAINKWLDNDRKLLFEMATGTGKTITALGCIKKQFELNDTNIVIIATPQNTLSKQWIKEVKKLEIPFDQIILCDGSNTKWRTQMSIALNDAFCNLVKNILIVTTHDTACSNDFVDIILRNKNNLKITFVCDEAHAIASPQQKKALLECYEYRIGLSATPQRMFDDSGTSLISKYFGSNSFVFSIREALTTINPFTGRPFLNPYKYIPVFVTLSDDEMLNYRKYSKMIAVEKEKEIPDEEKITSLTIKRAEIAKNAENKFSCFEDVINEINRFEKINNCIAFVSPQQIDKVMEICFENKIGFSKITEEESASKIISTTQLSERENIIKQFCDNKFSILLGIKCLDEGIDIPSARIALLLSNSINPREYVQRIGRVIRYAPNKKDSIIYDFIVWTDNENINNKEAFRALQIAENATNFKEVEREFEKKGVNLSCLSVRK